MNIQIYLLKSILNYDVYNKYGSHVSTILSENLELSRLFESIKTFHTKNPEKSITSVENLQLQFSIDYPILSGKDKSIYVGIFDRLQEATPDQSLVEQYLSQANRAQLALELATKAVALSEGVGSIEDITSLVERIGRDSSPVSEDLLIVNNNLDLLLEKQLEKGGINWRLDCLNKSIGPLRKGDFGFVFKRPETGGTTLLASEVSHMASQVDSTILWFNNEEQSEKVLLRCYQAVLGRSLEYIEEHRTKCTEIYQKSGGDRIIFPDCGITISTSIIERYCSKYSPNLVVIDQLDKITGFIEDRKDLEYGQIYRWARELAKKYCPVIGVSQASASAENKMWLQMDDIAESKTAKAAEADWILGIGCVDEPGKRALRYFSVCKNKLIGSKHTDQSMRHGRMTTVIKPELARYEDIK